MLETLQHQHISWTIVIVTLAAMFGFLFLQRLLPEHRRRGRAPFLLLILSLILRVAAWQTLQLGGSDAAAGVLNLLATLALAYGLTQLAGLILIDLMLGVLGVRIPAILRDLLQAIAFVISVMGVLRQSGVNLLGLVTTSAVLTAVIGLALQDTIANLFSGIALQLDRTIGVGDWIKVGDRVGRIDRVKLRSTSIVTKDGDYVIVPNSSFLKGEVHNFSKPTGSHRMWCSVGFAYRHPPNDVKKMLLGAIAGAPGVLVQPPPDVVLTEFGDSAVVYALRYWIADFENDAPIDGEVRTRIWYAAQRHGIEIPFPIRTVLLTQTGGDKGNADEREFLDRLGALAKIDLFATLDDADVELLAQGMKKVRFAVGERIIRQGEPGDSLYLVQEGEVGVLLAVDGAEREVATLRAGDFFGEMSLMTGDPRTATVAAKVDSTCFVVDHRSFQRLLEAKPKVAEDITTILSTRQSTLEGQREGISADAASRRAAEMQRGLLTRMKQFFSLG